MRYCPECGYEYKPNVTTCPDCKVDIVEEDIQTCEVCHEKTRDHETFCVHCGNFVSKGRKHQFQLTTKEFDVVGACSVCGNWVHEGEGRMEGHRWFCDQDDHYDVYEDWVVIYSTTDEHDALILKSQLDSTQIPAMVFNQKDRSYVMNVGDLAVIKVMVPKDRLDEAEDVLSDLDYDKK